MWYPACEDPTAPEIVDCCIRGLSLPAEIEVRACLRPAMWACAADCHPPRLALCITIGDVHRTRPTAETFIFAVEHE